MLERTHAQNTQTLLSSRIPRDTEHERYHPELEEELKECLFCLRLIFLLLIFFMITRKGLSVKIFMLPTCSNLSSRLILRQDGVQPQLPRPGQ